MTGTRSEDRQSVGNGVAQRVETLVKVRRRSTAAVRALRQVMDADLGLEESQRVGPEVIRALNKTRVEDASLAWLYARMGSVASGILAGEMMAGLYARHQYYGVIRMAQNIGCENISADIVRVSLASICKQQKHGKTKRPLVVRHRGGVAGFMDEYRGPGCPFRQLARRLVDLLAQRDPMLVSAAMLAKLLEIELSSVPPTMGLPRQVRPWLDGYVRYGVEASVHAFTILMHAYLRRGDSEFAVWIYQGMQRGSIVYTHGGRTESMRVPAPNDVALATVAQVWCQSRQWDRVHQALELMAGGGGLVSQRLVTRAVSAMVDDGDVRGAEELWVKYGCASGPEALFARVVNDRALSKLVLGCTRTKDVGKATGYFRAACEYARRSGTPVSHLTGLFNAVLRCALDNAPPHLDLGSLDGRRDLDILRIATLHNVRFDGDTYSVLISHLSRVAHAHALDDVARAMQNLYTRLCGEGIVLDDMTMGHLVPVWVQLDLCHLVTSYWRLYTRDRPPHKIAQVRRHIMCRAEHWGFRERVERLLV
ncbi:hypothetical protein FBU31_000238 [Coemansia sp. 'formosensis']|nr:hypothetical protein FBU31_000238 [Coemansia sp. 'formosensis']